MHCRANGPQAFLIISVGWLTGTSAAGVQAASATLKPVGMSTLSSLSIAASETSLATRKNNAEQCK
jgi:hypothetical protein